MVTFLNIALFYCSFNCLHFQDVIPPVTDLQIRHCIRSKIRKISWLQSKSIFTPFFFMMNFMQTIKLKMTMVWYFKHWQLSNNLVHKLMKTIGHVFLALSFAFTIFDFYAIRARGKRMIIYYHYLSAKVKMVFLDRNISSTTRMFWKHSIIPSK